MTPIDYSELDTHPMLHVGTRRRADRSRDVFMYEGCDIEVQGYKYIHRYKWTSRRAAAIRKLCYHTPFVVGFWQYPKPKGAA